jgi:hypothetical protein
MSSERGPGSATGKRQRGIRAPSQLKCYTLTRGLPGYIGALEWLIVQDFLGNEVKMLYAAPGLDSVQVDAEHTHLGQEI